MVACYLQTLLSLETVEQLRINDVFIRRHARKKRVLRQGGAGVVVIKKCYSKKVKSGFRAGPTGTVRWRKR